MDSSAAKRASRGTPSAQATRTAPPHWSATSWSGPSADGVNAPSQDVQATRASVQAVDEGLDEAGLADARLAGDEDEPAVAAPGIGGVFDGAPRAALPLEQAHGVQCHADSALLASMQPVSTS